MDEERTVWISFYLQDGRQTGCMMEAKNIDEAEDRLKEEYGEMYGGIADYWYDEELDCRNNEKRV